MRIFSTYFRNIPKYQISWKFVQWEPIVVPFGQTGRRSLYVTLRTLLTRRVEVSKHFLAGNLKLYRNIAILKGGGGGVGGRLELQNVLTYLLTYSMEQSPS